VSAHNLRRMGDTFPTRALTVMCVVMPRSASIATIAKLMPFVSRVPCSVAHRLEWHA
jgi:hypothetical protein